MFPEKNGSIQTINSRLSIVGSISVEMASLNHISGLWVFKGKYLAYSIDVNVKIYCRMAFYNYPFDKQVTIVVLVNHQKKSHLLF